MASSSGALATLKHGVGTGQGEGALLQKMLLHTQAGLEGATANGSTAECYGTVPSVEPCSTTLGQITARVGPVNVVPSSRLSQSPLFSSIN